MPENIHRTIPTVDELALRSDGTGQESKARLLGKDLNELQTSGQRLDFIDQAEASAYEDEAQLAEVNEQFKASVSLRVREILSSALDADDRLKIMNLINSETLNYQAIERLVSSLEEKYAKPASAVISETVTKPVATPEPAVSQVTEQVSETEEVKPRFDLSMFLRSENFVLQLPTVLSSLSNDELASILDSAANNWIDFELEDVGIKIPIELTRAEYDPDTNMMVDKKHSVSGRHTLLANAAAELWMRRCESILNSSERGNMGVARRSMDSADQTKMDLAQLQLLEKAADILFKMKVRQISQLVRRQMLIKNGQSPDKPSDLVVDENMRVVQELLDPRMNITEGNLKHVSASATRIEDIISGLRAALITPEIAIGLDVSVINRENPQSLTLAFLGANNSQWLEKMQQFVTLDKQLAETLKPA